MLRILHQDDHLVAVEKPAGLLAHPSKMAADATDSLMARLRDQLGRRVFLAHRLDRATSGVLVAAFDPDVAARLGEQFMERSVDKTYLALVRGWPESEGIIDYALDAPGKPLRKPAVTRFRVLHTVQLPIAIGRYASARWALMEVRPESGRYRQIRRHFHHIHHHVLGDTSHGDGRHNRAMRQHFGVHRLMLHAWRVRLAHPADGRVIEVVAPVDAEWLDLMARLGWTEPRSGACRTGLEYGLLCAPPARSPP
ncbi:MAG TPA: pseudouridine synthase [Xanthomonadaceae bacterium]|nr:pseudouridine synthase [Xanthomonadaceae bacterium]